MNMPFPKRLGALPQTLAVVLALCAPALSAEDYTQWGKTRSYRINTSSTGAFWDGSVANFPLLVRIAAGDTVLAQAKAAGADIRFTKADGVTRLQHEIDTWNPTTGAAIWVLVDSIKGNMADQVIKMFWGKADAADSSRSASVFNPANGYVAVWHMGGSANETDATGNGNTAVATGGPGVAAGLIGGGRSLSRDASQHFVVGDHASLNWTAPGLTLSAWVNATDWNGSSRIFQKGLGGDAAQYGLRETSLDRLAIDVNGTNLNDGTSVVPEAGTWALVHATVDGTSRKIYLNGAEVATADYPGGDLATTTVPLHLGRQPDAANYFNGTLDEMRVQKAARGPEWIAIEYQSQRAAQGLVQVVGAGTGIAGHGSPGAVAFSATARGNGAVFRVATATAATVTVSDTRGRIVWRGAFGPGARELAWQDAAAPAGLYVARLELRDQRGGAFTTTRPLMLVR